MISETVAEIRWRALDREGRDSCRLVRQHDDGWMLLGHARFRAAGSESRIDYLVRCDPDWHTLGADVTGIWDGTRVALHIVREGPTWTLNQQRQDGLDDAVDIDLSFTPATNLMPIRRMPEIGGVSVRAAWLSAPGAPLGPLDQRYTRGRGGIVHYAAEQTGFSTDLRVASSGFVTEYPGLWEAQGPV
ncbi:hypothetical protein ROJ8625_00728 [Roseivivax jejudonensis]|uniref:Glycolipid-binding protein n=1 Tax=Roseivivax jejudonensis TaxID=1529041 RepID=A0A1X6YFX9_9RHOB|nr:putative glycolipid-binding domain-containing protein [Roseivivax jejudonensis]SLN20280.1 hypothetical protein ROJ8625_00728 [Roseivivax jejudonensis]